MRKFTRLNFYSFHAFLLIFIIVGIYLAEKHAQQIFISAIYAFGLVLSLGLIIIIIQDVHQQAFSERDKGI